MFHRTLASSNTRYPLTSNCERELDATSIGHCDESWDYKRDTRIVALCRILRVCVSSKMASKCILSRRRRKNIFHDNAYGMRILDILQREIGISLWSVGTKSLPSRSLFSSCYDVERYLSLAVVCYASFVLSSCLLPKLHIMYIGTYSFIRALYKFESKKKRNIYSNVDRIQLR